MTSHRIVFISAATRLVVVAGLIAAASWAPLLARADEKDIAEPTDSKVNVLTYDNYFRFIERHQLILMEFYAPWCRHCQELAPQYREAAKQLSKLDLPTPVKLAKYDDADEYNRRLRAGSPEMYNYTSYPTLLVFQDGEHEFYRGGREAEDIVLYMSSLSKGLDPLKEEEKLRPGLYKKEAGYDPAVMIDLEPETFDEHVLSKSKHNNQIWIVEFYSDRCPFCKSLAPEMIKAAKAVKESLPGQVRFGGINSRIFHKIAERFDVTGWPWVSSFYMGEKLEDMAGLGGAQSVIDWATRKHSDAWKEGMGEDIPYDDGISEPGVVAEVTAAGTIEPRVPGEGESPATPSLEDIEFETMIDVAMKYNIMPLKSVQKMRKAIRTRKTTEEKAKTRVYEKLKPLLKLLKEVGKL